MLEALIQTFKSIDPLALIVGLLVGLIALFLLRAQQVWRQRRAFGYNVYAAYTLRQRLLRWGVFGLVAVALVGVFVIARMALSPAPPSPDAPADSAEATPLPTVLLIPRLAIEVPMIEAPFVAQQWDISRLKGEVAHLAGTAYPGDPGNAVLAGHITIPGAGWGPFQELETLEPGDRIFVQRGDDEFIYQVTEKMVVPGSNVEVAYPTRDSRLTLITCTDWDATFETYAQRIVVVARMTSSAP